MSARLLSQDYVRRELKKLKCRKITEYETTTLWETGSGAWFSVPHEGPDKRTGKDTFDEIVRDIERLNLFAGTRRL